MAQGLRGKANNNYDFGYDFNYAQWTAETVVTMCNVPWPNTYKDIVRFPNKEELNIYINNRPDKEVINGLSYNKPVASTVRIDTPFNTASKFNYLRATNPLQPVEDDTLKTYYYFILGVNYLSPNTTELVLQLDVWQTYGYNITIGSTYVERGHIGIANENQFDHYGRDYLTIPEGMDVGGEYKVLETRKEQIMVGSGHGQTPKYDVLICSTVDLTAAFEKEDGSPNLVTAHSSTFLGIPNGAAFYVASGDSNQLQNWMLKISNYSWVSQGIISLTIIPKINRYINGFDYSPDPDDVKSLSGVPPMNSIRHAMAANWRDDANFIQLPTRYQRLKKFFTYPYMVIEMTTWTGTPIIIKPESWNSDDATIMERVGLMPPNQRAIFTPMGYNSNTRAESTPSGTSLDDGGEYLDFATIIASFPTLPVVNNMAIGYMASNYHGIAFQNQSADWTQQRALAGNEAAYNNAGVGINTNQALTNNSNAAMAAQTNLANQQASQAAALGAVQGVTNGAVAGAQAGPAGAGIGAATGALGGAFGAASVGMSNATRTASAGVSMNTAQQNTADQNNAASIVANTNRGLGQFAASGDYANTLAGINAKVQDAQLSQPTTSGQIGGDSFNLVNDTFEVNLRWKLIDAAHLASIGDYWLRFGYAVQRFVQNFPASYMVMSKFTYWKLSETYITSGPMPEGFKQVIRGIFEKGVTVWADPADIGVTDWADNEPLSGVTL